MRWSLIFFISLVLLAASPARSAEMLQVENVRYGGAGDKIRLVLDLNHPADFRAFVLDHPYRVVVDIPLAQWKTYTSRLIPNSLVQGWRSGRLEEGLTRVIFDIKKPAVIDNIFIVPKDSFNKDRLVIDLVQSSENIFNAKKSEVAGNRNLKGSPGHAKPPSGQGYAAAENDLVKLAVPRPDAPALEWKAEKKYTVVIDPGHGGEDPGATSFGMKEKFITLAVAKELKRQMEETGRYKVVLTRDHDVYIKLHDRVDLSRSVKAELFISIHADKIDRNAVRGASIYTLSEKASDAETARLAEDENNSGFVAGVDLGQESQDVADILLDLAMREKMNESNMFSRMLMHAFSRKGIRLLPNSHRSAGFAVLKAPDVPSVLVESGFISNRNEAKLLSSGQFQRNIAAAILEGADDYFRKIQSLHKP